MHIYKFNFFLYSYYTAQTNSIDHHLGVVYKSTLQQLSINFVDEGTCCVTYIPIFSKYVQNYVPYM